MVMSAGQVTAGGSSSRIVTLKVQLRLLPLASVAMQVTECVPLAKVDPLGGVQSTLTPGQLSLMDGEYRTPARSHSPGSVVRVRFVGHVTAGSSLSSMVTKKVQVCVLPLVSVAVQVTDAVPSANLEPLAGMQLTVTPGQLSVTEGA